LISSLKNAAVIQYTFFKLHGSLKGEPMMASVQKFHSSDIQATINNAPNIIQNIRIDGNTMTALFHQELVDAGYLKMPSMFINYECYIDLSALDFSIYSIPFIMMVAPIAWISKRTWGIDEMDEGFFASLINVKKVLRFFYPKIDWSGNLFPRKLVKRNEPSCLPSRKYTHAALFSGGVDSTATVFEYINQKPLLISINTQECDSYRQRNRQNVQFARDYGCNVTFVRSNYYETLNIDNLSNIARRLWLEQISFMLYRFGLATPLLGYNRIPTLLVASSQTSKYPYPYGSHPLIDNALHFGGSQVIHHNAHLDRPTKMKRIASFCEERNFRYPTLQVCSVEMNENGSGKNCLECENCLYTMNNILLIEREPHLFGFPLEVDEVINRTRQYVSNSHNGLCSEWLKICDYFQTQKINSFKYREYFSWLSDRVLNRLLKYYTSPVLNLRTKMLADYFERSIQGVFDYSDL
jgi:hypothetical protein